MHLLLPCSMHMEAIYIFASQTYASVMLAHMLPLLLC